MDAAEQLHWLVFSRLPGNSPAIRRRLQLAGSSPQVLLEAPESVWREAGANGALLAELRALRRQCRRHGSWQQALRDQDVIQQQDAQLLPLGQAPYPPLLAQIYDPPPLLFVAGVLDALAVPQLAIVGSRRCSSSSQRSAREFASAMVLAGFGVTSGLARGIDAEAHAAALAAGGTTLAVMATGIEQRYPRNNLALAAQIKERGLLLTEFFPGSEPRREHFPQRNRVISGLCLGVLVVEATLRSGSLITARQALEQNREVFALPHSIYDPGGKGCHSIIRQGAKLVDSPQDIFEELGALHSAHRELLPSVLPAVPGHLRKLFATLGHAPVSADELALEGCIAVGDILAGLVELQLRGLIESRDGLYMRK